MKRSNLFASAAFLFVFALAWVGGYDFDERGATPVAIILYAVVAAAFMKIIAIVEDEAR